MSVDILYGEVQLGDAIILRGGEAPVIVYAILDDPNPGRKQVITVDPRGFSEPKTRHNSQPVQIISRIIDPLTGEEIYF